MSGIVLFLIAPLTERLDCSALAPDRCAELGADGISALPVWSGGDPRRRRTLGEFFRVDGERDSTLTIKGGSGWLDGLGSDMTAGELTIDGAAGRQTGARMSGGRIEVKGDVDHDAGLEMKGGVLLVRGNAGDNLGGVQPGGSKGTTGGEIVVMGGAGAEAGARMRRGVIFIGGDAGEYAGRGLIAGSVVIGGRAGQAAGQWSKRGSVVVLGGVEPPASYRYACTYRPPHLAVLLGRLRARYSAPVRDEHLTGLYRRFTGDVAELGKGEILAWTTG